MNTRATYKMNKIKIEVNSKVNCRVCMLKQIEMSYIFEENCDIVEKIEYCTGLKISKGDGLPTHICKNCMQDLATAYKFKSSCLLAYETYQNLLKSEIKTKTEIKPKTEIKTEVDYEDSCDSDFVWDEAAKAEPVKSEEEINAVGNSLPNKTFKNCSKGTRRSCKKKPKNPDAIKLNKKQVKARICCAECNIDFETKLEREEHMKNSHTSESEPWKWICEHCGKIFNKKSSMYSHALFHRPPRYSCDQCDYKATYKHDMTKHKHVHSGIKNIQCQICAARFRTRSQLTTHIRKEHEKVSTKKYMCQLCDKSFNHNYECKRHMDRHTSTKRYQCENCTSSFSERKKWRKHCLVKHNIAMPLLRPGKKKIYETKDNTIADS